MTEVKSTESLINKVSNSANSFIASPFAYILPAIVFAMGLVNLVTYGLGTNTISFIWGGSVSVDSAFGWVGWIEVSLSSVASALTIFGVILLIRLDKKFIIPTLIGEAFIFINAILVGYLFTALSYFLMIPAAIYSYIQWDKVDEDNSNQMTRNTWLFTAAMFAFYIFVGATMIMTINYELGGYDILDQTDWTAWLELISSAVVTCAWFVMLRKNKWGFLGFVITDITYVSLYLAAGEWATTSSYLVYMVIDTTSLLSWWTKDENIEERY